MVRARHDEEQSAGLWRIEMANALAQAAAEHEAAVVRCRFLAAAALDNASAHAENRCERLEEGFVRERDCSAVADVVLVDLGVQLREEQAMVYEFVEQYAESTKRVIDQECSDVKKHERDLVENAEALAWHEESGTTERRRELQQARMQVSRGSGLEEQQQKQLESASVEPLPERLGTLRTKAASDPCRVSSLVFGSSNDCWIQCGFLRVSMKSLLWLRLRREIVADNTEEECETVFCATGIKVPMVQYPNESCKSLSDMSSRPHGQTSAPVHDFSSVNMSNEVRYKSCSLHESIFSALQRDHCVCFDSHLGITPDPDLCDVNCPGNSSQFCGGDSWYTFHLMYLWVALVKAICSGMPEPVENNMPTSTTIMVLDFTSGAIRAEQSCKPWDWGRHRLRQSVSYEENGHCDIREVSTSQTNSAFPAH